MRLARTVAAFAAALTVAALAPSVATGHGYKLGDIAIGHFWARSPEKGADGMAVYGPILNRGNGSARLIGASTTVAERVRFRVVKEGKVRWPETIELRSGKPLAMAPWREHIWLTGANLPRRKGDSFRLTLDFGAAGQQTVKIVVEDASGH